MKFKSQLLWIAFGLVLLVFFFVWPGVWRYEYSTVSSSYEGVSSSGQVRRDRLTGNIQYWREKHWQ